MFTEITVNASHLVTIYMQISSMSHPGDHCGEECDSEKHTELLCKLWFRTEAALEAFFIYLKVYNYDSEVQAYIPLHFDCLKSIYC